MDERQREVGAAITEVNSALGHVAHNRWQLCGLHGGRLWLIADSMRPNLVPGTRCTRVTTLARRCLQERIAVTVSSVWPYDPGERTRDWEMDWPALVYVPVTARRRTIGVLIVGSRVQSTYEPADVEFLSDLGEVLGPWLRHYLDQHRPGDRRAA